MPALQPKTPGLALPFAVGGFASGWLSDGLLANPLVGLAAHPSQWTAALMAAVVCAGLGALLTRKERSQDALGGTPLTLFELSGLVIVAGAITGLAVGCVEFPFELGALSGAGNGALSAAFFIPVCALVIAAARRSARARHGSLVAEADRRAVWGILATALAVTTLAGAFDAPLARLGVSTSSRAAMATALCCGLLVLAILTIDTVALVRVTRLARAHSEAPDAEELRDTAAIPSLDLGLGDDVHAEVSRAASAYRSRGRATSLVLGSVGAARAALGRALMRGVAGLVITSAVLAGHGWAATPAAFVRFEERRCEDQLKSCYAAGLLLLHHDTNATCAAGVEFLPADERMAPENLERAEKVLGFACWRGHRCSCDVWLESQRERGVEEMAPLPSWYGGPDAAGH